MQQMQAHRFSRRSRAFTLVEILVVIAIIAVLLGMAVAVGNHVRTNAEIKNTKTTIEMLATALREYERLQGANTVEFPREPFNHATAYPWEFAAVVECCIGAGGTGDQHEIAPARWREYNDLLLEQQQMLLAARGSIEVLYYYLAQEPDCQAILGRLPDEMVKELDKTARSLRRTRAEVIRQAIEIYLEDYQDLTAAVEALRDPSDEVFDWEEVRSALLDTNQE